MGNCVCYACECVQFTFKSHSLTQQGIPNEGIHKRNTEVRNTQKEYQKQEYAIGIPKKGIRKRNTEERNTQKEYRTKEYAMDNQPNTPKEDEQSSSRPVNRYIRTPTASTTTQSTSSVTGQNQPREMKPPEKLRSMIAEKTTENYTKCIAKYNKFSQTHSSIPVYVMLRKEHLLKEGDEQLGLRNLLHNFAQWLLTEKKADGSFYAPGTALHFFSDFKTVLCENFQKLQIIKDIRKSTKAQGVQTWYSELYKMLEMRCYVAAIECGDTVCKKTLAVGRLLIIDVCKHLMSLNNPEAYES